MADVLEIVPLLACKYCFHYIMIPRAWKQQVFRADSQPLGYTGRAGI